MSADVLGAIATKRAGAAIPADVIAAVVDDYTAGRLPDYQMSAWLMAIACHGMDFDEVLALTTAYVDSGDRLDLARDRVVVDKHSTGGVGDKTTLIVAPVLAAAGVGVAKMSGRGLGFAGGTLDKLESVPGLRIDLGPAELRRVLADIGMVVVGQTPSLVPADGATYALRDVTGSVESRPLIAASIMSKKIAAGTSGVVLDVKFGSGALTGDRDDAIGLARLMIDLGAASGLRCRAVISDMSQPLGRAVGNALEVAEAIAVLRGEVVPGLDELCRTVATHGLLLADPAAGERVARDRVDAVLGDGTALDVFRRWVAAQGGDPGVVDDPGRLPQAPVIRPVPAPVDGWVGAVDAKAIGTCALALGAGRRVKDAPLDHAVGVVVHRRVGERVRAGELLAEVHQRVDDGGASVRAAAAAFTVGPDEVAPRPPVDLVLGPAGAQYP